MSLTREALEGVLQDTFLSEVRPPVCVCSLTSLTAPNRNITEWRPEHRETYGVGPGPASQLLSCLPYQERQVVTLRSTAQGWPSTLGARCPRATDPELEGALRTGMNEITRGEMQGVERRGKRCPRPRQWQLTNISDAGPITRNPN